jgi:hypothetical protein
MTKNDEKPRVIVDVDNILADFAPIFHEELTKTCNKIPHFKYWDTWNFYRAFINEKDFYNAAHAAQMRITETGTIVGAGKLLKFLNEHANVTVASHRRSESQDSLVAWMRKHCFKYDELHISYDKTQLFKQNFVLLIDDSPDNMRSAMENGMKAASIRCPWNECMEGTGAFIGETMEDVTDYVKSIL